MRLLCLTFLLLLAGLLGAQGPGNGGTAGPVNGSGKPVAGTPEAAKDQKPPAGKAGDAKPGQGNPGDQKPGEVKPGSVGPKPTVETEETEDIEDDEPIVSPTQLPASADPSDIAAMQSAQAMIRAEARLRRLLKKGAIQGIDKILTFEEISSWPYQDGLKGMPEPVKKMDAKTVLMTGFMLPIDEVENIKEFLLVQSLWSCCYGQPPDINGIVRVVMKGDKRINYKYDPIKVTGQFKVVASFEDGYCIDIYQLVADEVEVIK